MSDILIGLEVVCHMDNFLVFGIDQEEYEQHQNSFLERIHQSVRICISKQYLLSIMLFD